MNHKLFLGLLFLYSFALQAQDLIVTKSNDSLNTKITKFKKNHVHFFFMKEGELRSTLLPMSKVQTFKKGYFSTSEVPKNAKAPTAYNGKKVRINIEGGYGYRTVKVPGNLAGQFEGYLKKLKSGSHWGADIHYFINEHIGLGLRYNLFFSTERDNTIQTTTFGIPQAGIKDDIYITFIGPSMITRFLSQNKKNAFLLGVSLGYMHYRNDEELGNLFLQTTGETIGFALDLGYDIGLTDFLSLGISTSWTTGSIKNVKVDGRTVNLEQEIGDREGLSNLGIGIGLRFYL